DLEGLQLVRVEALERLVRVLVLDVLGGHVAFLSSRPSIPSPEISAVNSWLPSGICFLPVRL
ncbi:hypothetical protein ACIP4T_24185, partial [Streptomyces massasporeus]|uniref:hypothetical protein n=1 Tax=Streptomyces massasporeus TaxID=67324 RepID=UPI0036A1C9C8